MRAGRLLDQVKAQRRGRRGGPAAHVEFGEDMHQVGVDRTLADCQRHGNLFVRAALCNKAYGAIRG